MSTDNKIYLDHNATTPVEPEVLKAMLPYFTEHFGNAGSDHSFGWYAEDAVETARMQVAKLVNCRPVEIYFTSGATEAANLALFGFCENLKVKGNHIITCKTEHKAILEPMEELERKGFAVTYLNVDGEGNIDLHQLEESFTPKTILVSLMYANNETGLIHPIKTIADIVHGRNAALMVDMTQAVGKIPVDLKNLDIDLGVFSAHKMYGPKGVGALYVNKKKQLKLEKILFGGNQEKGMRPGTLNVPGIVGFGAAAASATNKIIEEGNRLLKLRNRLENQLSKVDGLQVNGQKQDRLPNTTNISIHGIDGSKLLRHFKNLAVSRGSACNANLVSPSHVLKAMGHSDELALSSIRISSGRQTTEQDIDNAIEEICSVVDRLKTVSL
ncbi:cysteine desulfurase family protein [Flagellimonas beolgyonensis]|uniref:cysteine desulfurase family protein n=1 Tax=Flagellimonas beolgyonensis TaxID=864064 RepID=UPI003D64E555